MRINGVQHKEACGSSHMHHGLHSLVTIKVFTYDFWIVGPMNFGVNNLKNSKMSIPDEENNRVSYTDCEVTKMYPHFPKCQNVILNAWFCPFFPFFGSKILFLCNLASTS